MINEDARRAVDASRWNDGRWVKPLYDSYGFARIPSLIEALFAPASDPVRPQLLGPLGSASYEAVVLLFVDAFGWTYFERFADHLPLLRRAAADGTVAKLTTQFPSTTTAHMTTINTGLSVGRSGLYEWQQFEPLADGVIIPLLFSLASDNAMNTLSRHGVSPSAIYPSDTLYQRLAAAGVRSYAFGDAAYADTPFNAITFAGAQSRPFATLQAGLDDLGALLRQGRGKGPAYYFFYIDDVDAASHRHGPRSAAADSAVEQCFSLITGMLDGIAASGRGDTLVLLTADHGQIDVDPGALLYLDQSLPTLREWTHTNAGGDPLAPAGSSRDFFLHIKPEYMDEAFDALRAHLDGQAMVCRVPDLIAQGFFGPVSDAFRARVGDLVVLPEPGKMIWWWGDGRYKQVFKGHHGGMTPQEMETLLLALPL